MSERTYYVYCEDNCKFEGMTKQQVINAITEATGATPTSVDDAFITMIKEQNGNRNLKFWVGTQAQYNALTPANDVVYIITDGDALGDISARVTNTESDITGLKGRITTAEGAIVNINAALANIIDAITYDDEVDGWHVRKWVGGRIEAEKTFDISEYTYSTYAPVYHAGIKTFTYPTDLFTSVANVSINLNTPFVWTGGGTGGHTQTTTDFFSFTDNPTGNISAHITVIGE